MRDKELKVFDLFKDGKGVFQFMNEIQPLPFSDVLDIKTLDLTFITFYGGRDISAPVKRVVGNEVTKENLEHLAYMLYGMYFQKWANLYAIYSEQVDLDSYVLKTTEKIKDDGTNSSTTNTDVEGKDTRGVAGYNSEDFEDESQNTNKTTDNTTNEGTTKNLKDRETESRGNLGNRIEDREKALQGLKDEVIYDVVFKDTVQLLGSLMF